MQWHHGDHMPHFGQRSSTFHLLLQQLHYIFATPTILHGNSLLWLLNCLDHTKRSQVPLTLRVQYHIADLSPLHT